MKYKTMKTASLVSSILRGTVTLTLVAVLSSWIGWKQGHDAGFRRGVIAVSDMILEIIPKKDQEERIMPTRKVWV